MWRITCSRGHSPLTWPWRDFLAYPLAITPYHVIYGQSLSKKVLVCPPQLAYQKNFQVDIERKDLGKSTMIEKIIINIAWCTNIRLLSWSWVYWTWKLMSGWFPVHLESINRPNGWGASCPGRWSFEEMGVLQKLFVQLRWVSGT